MNPFKDVKNWHRVFQAPVGSKKITDPEFIKRRKALMVEEIQDEMYKALDDGDLVEFFDGCLDSIFVIIGNMVELGLPMEEGWKMVVESNFSKLGEDGKPIFNKWGKITKGPNTFYPDLAGLLKKHGLLDE